MAKISKKLHRKRIPSRGNSVALLKQPIPESKARTYGYARVSTEEQSLDMQITKLQEAGVLKEHLFYDKLSAKNLRRPWFNLLKKQMQGGDTLKVYSVSRLFRDTEKLLAFFTAMKAKGIKIKSLTETLDLDSAQGRLVATILAAVDQMEREQISTRTKHGMAERKRQGQAMGRAPKVTATIAKRMKYMRFKRRIRVPAIAARFRVSPAAVYLHTNPKKQK